MSALTVTLGADITSMKRSLGGAMGILSGFAKRISGLFSVKGGIVAALGGTGLGAATAKLTQIGEVSKAGDRRLRNITRSMGLFGAEADKVTERLIAYADQMEVATGIEGAEIQLAQSKLMTFANLAKTANQMGGEFDRATRAAVDLAAAGFGEASQNAVQLGKALQDPVKGITALARSGVTFTKSEKDRIKSLVAQEKHLEAQRIILKAVEQQVGGTAEASAKSSQRIKKAFMLAVDEMAVPVSDMLDQVTPKILAFIEDLKPKIAGTARLLVAIFTSGQVTDLVATALKVGFAEAVNSLVNGFRIAAGFLWHALTDGGMWANLGKLYAGVAVKFYNKILRGMEAVINFLAAGMEWVGGLLVKQLLKIPGVDKLLGIRPEDVTTDFGQLYQGRKDGRLFGLDLDGMERFGDELAAEGSSGLAERLATAAAKAIGDAAAKGELIDTSAMQEKLAGIILKIRETLPKPEEVKAAKAAGSGASPVAGSSVRLDPIITSLGKVGGGGYGTGVLDAQRENNRLTGETNRLLQQANKHLSKLGGLGTPISMFS